MMYNFFVREFIYFEESLIDAVLLKCKSESENVLFAVGTQ